MKRLNKKGVSIMIAYILLISIAIIIAFFVYQWLKTYVPKDVLECPEDVSLLINKHECMESEKILKLTVENNGLFTVHGYILRGKTEDGSVKDLSGENDGYFYFEDEGGIEPSDDAKYNNFGENIDEITLQSIEIIPIRIQENDEGRNQVVICGDAKLEIDLEEDCTIGGINI